MKEARAIIIPVLFALAVMLQGCVTRVGDFTLASTKNLDLQGGLHAVSERTRVEGSDYKFFMAYIPFGTPDLEEAMDNAIEQTRGSVGLTNVTIKYGEYGLLPWLGVLGVHVEGDPVFEIGGKPDAIITP